MAENTTVTRTLDNTSGTKATAVGSLVFDATSITAADYVEVDLGFKPVHVNFQNVTDRVSAEHFAGMADNTCTKTAATGTRTASATGITLTDRGFRVSQNATLAVIAASKTCYFTAQG